MIELIQSPAPGRIIADGNNTYIKVKSTFGQERYFRAFIYINEQLLYDQVWSKDANNVVEHNLRHLYLNYFYKEFTPVADSSLNLLDLKRKVTIVLKEIETSTDQEIDELVLPEFYVIKSIKPQDFLDRQLNTLNTGNSEETSVASLRFLDFNVDVYRVPKGSAIRVPLFINSGNNNQLNVSFLNPENTAVYNISHSVVLNTAGVYHLDIKSTDIPQVYPYLKLLIQLGSIRLTLDVEYAKNLFYPAKSVYYENNFGVFCLAHLFGKKTIEHSLKAESFTDKENQKVNFEVKDEKNIEINTGYAFAGQTKLHHAIATSLDVRLITENYTTSIDSRQRIREYVKVVSETKKVLIFEDGVFNFEDTLKFSMVNYTPRENNHQYLTPPVVEDIEVAGMQAESLIIEKALLLNAYYSDFPAEKIRFLTATENGHYGRNYYSEVLGNNINGYIYYSQLNTDALNLDTLNSIFYNPNAGVFGQNLDVISFQIFNGYMWSEPAQITINIEAADPQNLPPLISWSNSLHEIAINQAGTGKVNLGISVQFFGGQGGTYEWGLAMITPSGQDLEFNPDNGDVSFTPSNTVQSPFIHVQNPTDYSVRPILLRATDAVTGLTTDQVFLIDVLQHALRIEAQETASDSDSTAYQITIDGGAEGETVEVYHDYYGVDSGQYAKIASRNKQFVLNDKLRKNTEVFAFDKSGVINYTLEMKDFNKIGMDEMKIKIISASGNQVITAHNQTLIQHEPTN